MSAENRRYSDRVFRKAGLAVEGWPFVLAVLIVGAVVFAMGFVWAGVFSLFLALLVAGFFRDPQRKMPTDPDLLISPADGKVIKVDRSEDGGLHVAIFLSVFDVHVNRSPIEGTVERVRYRPGRYLAAFKDEVEQQNERNELWLDTARGRVKIVQIAGLIARRIVCRVKPGEIVPRGERFGLIRFGSRTDLHLPPGAEALVEVGDRVRGAQTPVARWIERKP